MSAPLPSPQWGEGAAAAADEGFGRPEAAPYQDAGKLSTFQAKNVEKTVRPAGTHLFRRGGGIFLSFVVHYLR